MKRQPILAIILCVAIFALITGCMQSAQSNDSIRQEQSTDSGILSIKSTPSAAQAYVNGELKGNTPLELNNFPIGAYTITIKKEGYSDFEKSATVKVGIVEEIDAKLVPLQTSEDNISTATQPSVNDSDPMYGLKTANISGGFVVYYDFKKGAFTSINNGSSDVFSSNYGTYIRFTAIAPSMMEIVEKPIEDIKKEDCQSVTKTFGNLQSGQTLCIKTTDGRIAAIGGVWSDKADILEWIIFS